MWRHHVHTLKCMYDSQPQEVYGGANISRHSSCRKNVCTPVLLLYWQNDKEYGIHNSGREWPWDNESPRILDLLHSCGWNWNGLTRLLPDCFLCSHQDIQLQRLRRISSQARTYEAVRYPGALFMLLSRSCWKLRLRSVRHAGSIRAQNPAAPTLRCYWRGSKISRVDLAILLSIMWRHDFERAQGNLFFFDRQCCSFKGAPLKARSQQKLSVQMSCSPSLF